MTDDLQNHSMLRSAAGIARTFRIDPVEVLNGSFFEWSVRLAAHNVVMEMEKKNAPKTPKK